MYGAASLMNRLPAPLTTNCDGIIRSLSMNCSRPSGQHIAGNHHASSSRSVEAPTFSPARIPSPMAAGLPKLQSFSRTGRCSRRHSMSWSKPPLARMTPPRAPMRCVRPSRSTTAPVTAPSAPSPSRINSIMGASSHSGMPWSCHRQPHPRGQRLSDGGHPVAEDPRPEHPPDQLHQHSLAAPVLPDLVEEPKILGGEPDSLRRQRQRLQQVLLLVAEFAQVDGGDVDGAAQRRAARHFGVVVGVAGLPDEVEPGAALLEELHHLRRRVDVGAQARVTDQTPGDPPEVVECLFGVGCVALPALRRCTRHPDTAAGQCGGTTELRGLLDDQGVQAGGLRGQRGGHTAAATTDDQYIHDGVEVRAEVCSRSCGHRRSDGEPGDQVRRGPVVTLHSLIGPRGRERGEGRHPGADFVRGVAGLSGDPAVRPRVDARRAARCPADPGMRDPSPGSAVAARLSPWAKSCAAAITAACRAARCSTSSGRRARCGPGRRAARSPGSGTGGSCDSPPDPTTSTRLSSVARKSPIAAPSARTRRIGPSGVATELMKIGITGTRGGVAEQRLQRLNRAVVDVHARRDRDVDARVENRGRAGVGDVGRDVQRSCWVP